MSEQTNNAPTPETAQEAFEQMLLQTRRKLRALVDEAEAQRELIAECKLHRQQTGSDLSLSDLLNAEHSNDEIDAARLAALLDRATQSAEVNTDSKEENQS